MRNKREYEAKKAALTAKLVTAPEALPNLKTLEMSDDERVFAVSSSLLFDRGSSVGHKPHAE